MSTVRLKIREEDKAQETSEAVTYTEAEIAKLIERAAGGDFGAFGELYIIYLNRIYRYVFYQVRDKMTAEDLTEEIFLKAWKAIKKYKGKGRSFSAWLYRIAHNYVIDYYRTKRADVTLETQIPVESSHPEQEVEEKLRQRELLEAISHLAPQQRQVIILKFIEGLENREIEQITGKSQGAIRMMQMRALTTLRERLNGEREKWELSYQWL